MERDKITRRYFMMSSAALAAGAATTARAKRSVSPNEKLNVAGIGVGGKGDSDVRSMADGNNIVALCDVDERRASATFKRFDKAPKYKDFRVMLDKEHKNIDAVTISTPDSTHAVAAMAAMELGIHVFVQKPLTHDIHEARMLTEAARKYNVATHMGNQGHAGEGVRRVCEWIWADRIGDVRAAHIWTNRPVWPQPAPRPTETPPVPDEVAWDLWLGPAPERPYHPCYLPHNWRGWWDFGCGALGDMGCHIMDPSFTALRLGYPTAVEALSQGNTMESGPAWSVIHYEFPARGGMPPVDVYWYDGGVKPYRPEGVPEDEKLGDGDNGTLFVGDNGMLTCGEYGGSPRLVPYVKPEVDRTIPKSTGHYQEWIDACKGIAPTEGNLPRGFDYAGPFTEMVLLGNLAIRCGQRVEWDGPNMTCTNLPEANQLAKREYREGWSL